MRTVTVKLLPDGSGRVRIHWLELREDGPVKTPEGTVPTSQGPIRMGGAVGRIACAPRQKKVGAVTEKGETSLVVHSDDPRAVTCPECQEKEEYKAAMRQYDLLVDTARPVAGKEGA